MKKIIESRNFQQSKLVIGFSLMLIGLYLCFQDNSILNNGILGTGILLSAGQTTNLKK
ncbi:MAG: uncharacterized membrane-anchored protein YitT (DUF2179 family) [Flavobacterium sp.]|jgi:uncharacterized membrane-anchored protein YitT (DUF2179 family)